MNRYFTKTFLHFLFGFLVIIAIAFVVAAIAGNREPQAKPQPIDNIATQG